jgi:hypothetical protein
MNGIISNVVRFPIERRRAPSLELLHELAPDSREVWAVLEDMGLEGLPDDHRAAADREMAEQILNEVPPEPGERRQAALAALLDPLVKRSVDACREAIAAKSAAAAALAQHEAAAKAGGYWMTPLLERVQASVTTASNALIRAYIAYQETVGAARAIGLAQRDVAWTPFDAATEAELLFFGERAASA